jgi:hypothetical protein
MENGTVQSLWVGARLSTMEQLSIRSYLDQGHDFHLFTYGCVEGVPAGASVRSGEEVLPAADIFRYKRGRGRGSVSAFSNRFRYRLLLDRGGWWSDLDSVCVRPLDFDDDHVLGYERSPGGGTLVGTGLFKAPAGSRLMEYCWHVTREVDVSRLEWGEIGPRLMTRAVAAAGVPVRIMAPEAFFPIDFWRIWQLVLDRRIPDGCHAIHLWNSGWRLHWLDPDAVYHPDCIYEQLKRRYGVSSPPDATRGPSRKATALSWLRLLRRWMRSGRFGADR